MFSKVVLHCRVIMRLKIVVTGRLRTDSRSVNRSRTDIKWSSPYLVLGVGTGGTSDHDHRAL